MCLVKAYLRLLIALWQLSEINNADIVLGAVAWLTDHDLLEAISKKPCQIVVQKRQVFLWVIDSRDYTYYWKTECYNSVFSLFDKLR